MAAKKQTVQRTLFSAGGVILLLVILILVNVVFARVVVRYDATDDNRYSLSDGTRQILGDLDEPITLHFYLSRSLATFPLREAREVFEREYLMTQINRFGGNISRTANFVGMERSALHRKLKSLGVVTTNKAGARVAQVGEEH